METSGTAYVSARRIVLGVVALAGASIVLPACNLTSDLPLEHGSGSDDNPAESPLPDGAETTNNIAPRAVAGEDLTAQVGETLVFDA
jgi:hypothetical protein